VALNRAMWDELVPIHVASSFYDVDGFRAGAAALPAFVVEEMGSVDGRDLLHLQCHFGLETLDWARRGARVTGLDFSEPAIAAARGLAAELGIDARFVVADVHDAPEALGCTYDVIHTGLGALCWLPDITRWAAIVARLLRPGGVLHLTEFHPVEQVMADDEVRPMLRYREGEALAWEMSGSYADPDAVTVHNRSVEWVHPLGAVVGALLAQGLVIEALHERVETLHLRWPFLRRDDDARVYRFPEGAPEIPLIYTVRARRPPDRAGGRER
jgi:SAM-dependent methyltransferase